MLGDRAWYVQGDNGAFIDNLTEAEAKLFTFVLNEWSSGHAIVAIDPMKALNELAVTHDGWNFYEGPAL